MKNEVWCVPLGADTALLYAPFHGILTLANRALAELVACFLDDPSERIPEEMDWIRSLLLPGKAPGRKRGKPDPLYLGLIPTRACMMRCAYCDFIPLRNRPAMSFEQIRRAVDGYAELMKEQPENAWNIHFFGGEPFAAFKEVVFAVNYARKQALLHGASTHFEVTTNGFYSADKCRWIAENIDTVVLSIDGFPDVQNRHRSGPSGEGSFPVVCGNADILSRGSCQLIIRSCVSAENAGILPEWSAWAARRWFPDAVCLEPMIESPQARRNGLHPPDPVRFARSWAEAFRILKAEKIRLVYSSGEISSVKNSLCPVGQDALIVSPDGIVGGCWQLAENQNGNGLDLRFGSLAPDGLYIDRERLEKQRVLHEANRESCRGCFCYAHCAGGCILNRERNGGFCRLTRMLTLWQLLEKLGYGGFADTLLADPVFTDQLAAQNDFSCRAAVFPDTVRDPDDANPVRAEVSSDMEPDLASLPPLPVDMEQGWVRDGEDILFADLSSNLVSRFQGQEAVRFQLDHSGLLPAEAEAVLSALEEMDL